VLASVSQRPSVLYDNKVARATSVTHASRRAGSTTHVAWPVSREGNQQATWRSDPLEESIPDRCVLPSRIIACYNACSETDRTLGPYRHAGANRSSVINRSEW
jgi:hypothetical protein